MKASHTRPVHHMVKDVPLNPGEKILWEGKYHRMADMKLYIGFALSSGIGIFALLSSDAGNGGGYDFWTWFLFICLFFVSLTAALVQEAVQTHKTLLAGEMFSIGAFSLMASTVFLSMVYDRIVGRYSASPPPAYIPQEYRYLVNISVSSIIFLAVVLFLAALLSSIKSELPRGYRKTMGVSSIVLLVVAGSFFVSPDSGRFYAAYYNFFILLFGLSMLLFSFLLFVFVVGKDTFYILTTERMIIVREYFGREVLIRYYKNMKRAVARQGVLGRRYGYGDLIILSNEGDGRDSILFIHGMPEPFRIENIIYTRKSGGERK